MRIHDGSDREAPILGTFCGDRGPKTIVSSSSSLLVHFKTDLSGEDVGFHASYISGVNCKWILCKMDENFPQSDTLI